MSHTNDPSQAFDVLDPHGFEQPGHGQHHSHVIVGPFTLRNILVALLFLTLLTVGQAQAEAYLAHAFHIEFPRWVNVVFCMGIAVVKALLVMAYFMQLKYDNPLNTVVMAVTLFAFILFLGFTSIDLGSRGMIYAEKGGQLQRGGIAQGGMKNVADGHAIVTDSRERWLKEWGPEKFAELEAHASHAHAAEHHTTRSDRDRSRPSTGISGVIPGVAAPDHGTSSHGAAEHAPASH
ncbi:MAG: cytochrome C oxidase subunit IV family protein [Phycisphaerales bacterium]|nr:MAG: cytochrome C oxidase subunit IV family protein [Phycisphaerales bacterium]